MLAVVLVAVVLLSCDRGKGRADAGGSDASVSLNEKKDEGAEWKEPQGVWMDLAITTHLWPLAGPVDAFNRYPAAVRVTVEFEGEGGMTCGGVLISRRLILTAGHCVCQKRQALAEQEGAHTRIDGSACAKTATVMTMLYKPSEDWQSEDWQVEPAARGKYQPGTVRPHPELRILFDAQGRVVSSHADLALVLLKEAAEVEYRPLPLADEEIHLNETLVIVGSGYDETAPAYDGARRFSRNKVVEVLPSGGGRMRIEQPGGHHYLGDSGGPCLREGAGGTVLVGISSRNLGEGEAITSIHGYLDWLRSEIRRVQEKGSSTKP